jgi:hypothetical protein
MRKNYFFTLLFALCTAVSFAQTTLAAGDLVVIEFRADSPDTFRFVPLVDLEAGTVIKFSEGGWNETAQEINTNESIIVYTAPNAITAGTNVRFEADDITNNPSVWAFEVGTFVGFSTSGDQLLVYQGDTSNPTFIFAVASNSTEWQTGAVTDSNQSALPLGLTDGVNAVAAGAGSGPEEEFDNIYYNGTTSGTALEILAAVASVSNWVGDNGTSYTPISTDFTVTPATSDPVIIINSPSDGQTFDSSTTEVPVTLTISNFTLSGDAGGGVSDNTGDGYIVMTLQEPGEPDVVTNEFSTTPGNITVTSGTTYTLTTELVDNTGASLSTLVSSTVTFSVDFPCDLELDTINATCDAETTGIDTYTATISFTGGNTGITYSINTSEGTIGGDSPDTTASGTITITGITEGTDITVTVTGGSGSSCDITRNISSPTCVPAPTCPAPGSIIITEIMQNPSVVSDSDGEYFEVFNTTGAAIDLLGWVLMDSSSASEIHTIASSVIVPANGYVVLGTNTDTASNGGVNVDYDYGDSYFLGNGTDDIVLDCGGDVIDAVEWDNGATFPDPNGASMELAVDKYTAADNDFGENWGEATSEIQSGGDLGTPGAVNDFSLSTGQVAIEGFAAYPNPVRGNELTVTSANIDRKNVEIFNVLGRKVFSQSFDGTRETINISNVASGIYILKVTEGTKISTQKLIIE